MKKRSVLLIVLIITAVIAVVLGCATPKQSKFITMPLRPQLDGALLYNKAIQKIKNSNEFSYSVQSEKKTITPKNTYTESRKQDISCTDFQLSVSETISIGDYTIRSACQYENGTAYLRLGESRFSASLSQADLQNRCPPAILLNPSNYNTIQAHSVSTGTVIYFHSATTPEIWAQESNMAFQQAAGIARLDQSGALTETIYCITYKLTDTVIEKAIIVKPTEKTSALEPINREDYIPVDNLDAPLALEFACGYLLQSNTLSSQATDTITCNAFGDRFIQEIALNYKGTQADFSASLCTSLLQQNSSRGGEITESSHALTFSNGICSVSANSSSPVTDPGITQDMMLKYCQDVLIGSVLLPKDVVTASFTETEKELRYDFTASKALANRILDKACLALYNDSTFLQKLASSYGHNDVTAYIILDKLTMRPMASGISYTGTYVIENFPYVLSYTAEQVYN